MMADYEFKSEAKAWVMIPLLKNNGKECVLDMRPLVLCKDCKHGIGDENAFVCGLKQLTAGMDWFCADGKRKEDKII